MYQEQSMLKPIKNIYICWENISFFGVAKMAPPRNINYSSNHKKYINTNQVQPLLSIRSQSQKTKKGKQTGQENRVKKKQKYSTKLINNEID